MADGENECKVYVGSLKFETDKNRLIDHFSSAGQVVDGTYEARFHFNCFHQNPISSCKSNLFP